MNRILATLWVALGLVLGLGVHAAQAKPKTVALPPIEGDANGSVGTAVVDALDGDQLTMLSSKMVTRAVDKLGYAGELTDKQAKKLAGELEADVVIQGTLARDGKHKVLHFKLLVRGKKARGFKVTFNNPKSENFKTRLRDKMIERLDGERAASADDTADADDADDDGPKKKPKKTAKVDPDEDDASADEDQDEPVKKKPKKKKKKKSSDDEDVDDEGEDEEPVLVSPHTANRAAIRVDVGISAQNRTLAFTQRSNFPEGPSPYTNSLVPGARIEGELYPFAFANPNSVAAGLGVAGEFDRTLLLTLHTTAEPSVPVKAIQQHWSIGARFRILFGNKPTSASVTLGAGFGSRSWTAKRSVLMNQLSLDVPDTKYSLIDPGLSFRIPVAPTVALLVGGKALIITDAGPIQEPDSYGRAKVFGVSAQAGVDILLGSRFAVRLVAEFVQIGFSFTGTGAMSNARDRDPMTQDIGGASDRSLGAAATFAVRY